jgi:hypothetical protein
MLSRTILTLLRLAWWPGSACVGENRAHRAMTLLVNGGAHAKLPRAGQAWDEHLGLGEGTMAAHQAHLTSVGRIEVGQG